MGGQPQVSIYISHIADHAGWSPSPARVWSAKGGACLMAGMEYGGIRAVLRASYLGSVLGNLAGAATWQLTIVAGVLDAAIWKKEYRYGIWGWSVLVLAGVFMMQVPHLKRMEVRTVLFTLAPILVAAFSYPLGNRKMMALCPAGMTTLERVYGMTLCSMPFWIFMSGWAWVKAGPAGRGQVFQSRVWAALFSGVLPRSCFCKAGSGYGRSAPSGSDRGYPVR